MRSALALVFLTACSSPATPEPVPPRAAAAPQELADIPLPSAANGLAWDATEKTLYIAADTKLLAWQRGTDFTTVAELPTPGASGVVRLADGSFLVTVFGMHGGGGGGVLHVDANHQVAQVPNLDPARHRVGIAVGPDAAIYDAYFTIDGQHHHTGGLAKLDLVKGETDVPLGAKLTKVVGVVATKRGVFVSDQEANAIYAAGNATPIATGLPSADLLAAAPDGTLVTGGANGVVSKIDLDGKVTTIVQGYESARGVAIDPDGKRLFVVEHGKAKHVLHVVKLPG